MEQHRRPTPSLPRAATAAPEGHANRLRCARTATIAASNRPGTCVANSPRRTRYSRYIAAPVTRESGLLAHWKAASSAGAAEFGAGRGGLRESSAEGPAWTSRSAFLLANLCRRSGRRWICSRPRPRTANCSCCGVHPAALSGWHIAPPLSCNHPTIYRFWLLRPSAGRRLLCRSGETSRSPSAQRRAENVVQCSAVQLNLLGGALLPLAGLQNELSLRCPSLTLLSPPPASRLRQGNQPTARTFVSGKLCSLLRCPRKCFLIFLFFYFMYLLLWSNRSGCPCAPTPWSAGFPASEYIHRPGSCMYSTYVLPHRVGPRVSSPSAESKSCLIPTR